jgi:hypothetical protein
MSDNPDRKSACEAHRNGSWAPKFRGHVFYEGILGSTALEEIDSQQSQAESACFARKGRN